MKAGDLWRCSSWGDVRLTRVDRAAGLFLGVVERPLSNDAYAGEPVNVRRRAFVYRIKERT
jgi:hypothetical protein